MSQRNHIVFVYGSLRAGEKYHARYLSDAEPVARQCWTHGELFDTGLGYPALVPHPDKRVYGELYRVNSSELRRLDDLEDYREGDQENQYNRVRRTVFTDDGRKVDAEMYLWAQPEEGMPMVRFGDWRCRHLMVREEILYFAYGSCMDDERFRLQGVAEHFQNCLGRGVLTGYSLRYPRLREDGGRADIVEDGRGTVEGKVYWVGRKGLKYLYRREGVDSGLYRPALVEVEIDGRRVSDVMTFIVRDKTDPEAAPPEHYAREILRGAEGTVSDAYLERLRRELKERFGMEVKV